MKTVVVSKYGLPDMRCPNCLVYLDVEWNTDHGNPVFGEHDIDCAGCKKKFSFCVFPEYKVW